MPYQPDDPADVTLESYERAFEQYISATPNLPSPLVEVLVDAVPGGALVLELGSGPGWDALAMEEAGLTIQRTDGARAFVDHLRAHGHSAYQLDVRAPDFGGPYDAVFANAVFLHIPRAATQSALEVARRAVRPGGLLVASFKAGEGEGWSFEKLGAPRHFTYWGVAELAEVFGTAGWDVLDILHPEPPRTDASGFAVVARTPCY